jgi:hypothetical protein
MSKAPKSNAPPTQPRTQGQALALALRESFEGRDGAIDFRRRRRFRELKFGSGNNGEGNGQMPASDAAQIPNPTMHIAISGRRRGRDHSSNARKSNKMNITVPAAIVVVSHGL